MRTRLTTMLAASLLAVAMLAAPAAAHGDDGHDDGWGPMGPHPHALLINATTVPNPAYPNSGPPAFPIAWDRCVDLAGGKALPKSNHHRGIHTGTAGTALRENAGHLVVPVDCATLEAMRSG